jgi:hypothetical protein
MDNIIELLKEKQNEVVKNGIQCNWSFMLY